MMEVLNNIICNSVIGINNAGFKILYVETINNEYGIAIGKNDNDNFVTWQFHFENGISFYWGHYFTDSKVAFEDFFKRISKFKEE